MSAVKKALQMLKIPDVTNLSDRFALADSHKLIWAAVCLASGCLFHEVVPTSFLPLILAAVVICACLAALRRQLSLCFGLLPVLPGCWPVRQRSGGQITSCWLSLLQPA